jgi:protein CLEC16A
MEDLTSQYVSFLKTLSLRLNENTVQFFLGNSLQACPLYDCVLRFAL